MPLDPVETLQRLIQTPSVNPMGRDVSGPHYGESRMTELLSRHLPASRAGLARGSSVHPGRDNFSRLSRDRRRRRQAAS